MGHIVYGKKSYMERDMEGSKRLRMAAGTRRRWEGNISSGEQNLPGYSNGYFFLNKQ